MSGKWRRRACLALCILLAWAGPCLSCHGQERGETQREETSRGEQGETQREEQGEVSWEELLGALDTSEVDRVLGQLELPEKISFGELVMGVIQGEEDALGSIGRYIEQLVWGQWRENKAFLVELLFLILGFALLKNFAQVFDKGYVSQVSFLLVYCMMMALLMKSLFVLNQVVSHTINTVIQFMTAFIPVFATTMVLSTGDATAAGFYQMGFLIIYILQWILGYILVPFVRIYVLVGLINQVMEEAPFGKFAELLSTGILWCLKVVTSLVLGLNVIKSAIAPLQDTVARATIRRSLSMIPGIGSTLSAASDLFLASGGIIKNGVGMAALILLILICVAPLVKLIVMTFLYKLLGAVVEPVADRRISGALHVVAQGSSMLFRILTTCIILVFITVAMTTLLGQKMF